MSAIPLPSLPVTPAPAPAPSPAPARTSQSGNSAFNAHLQNVQQQQQQQQSASEAQDASQQAAARQNSNQASANTKDKSSAKPGDDASSGSAQSSSDASDDSSIPTSMASLANTVLNLIDQATGDAGKGKTANTNGTKPATAKPTTQGKDQPQPGAAQALGLVAPLPPPVVPAASAAAKGDDGGAANSNGVNALQANGKDLKGSLAASLQKGANSVDDSDDDGDTKAVGATADNNASAQTAGDSTQAFASALSAVSHAAAGQADTTASTASPSSSTPDIAALHGVADAAAVVAPPVTPAAGTHTLSVNAPVGSSGFAKELGHQVTWLSGQDIKQAQIKLNPQDLGPLDVKVSIEHGRVDVAFMTQHAATATAVQQGLDQLHQMLGGQGLSLGHTSVGQHASQQQFADQQRQSSGGQMSGDSDQPVGNSTGETLKRVAIGLVDAFA